MKRHDGDGERGEAEPRRVGLIALLTDFGLGDPYVGVMKGVLLARAPEARVVDLSHGVPPHNARLAAFHLMCSARYFPEGTLFVCVVDPGVGSKRRALWARSARHQFLAPDNGLLSWLDRVDPLREARELQNKLLFLDPVSASFHGRDIFAPVAAALARGTSPEVLGPRLRGFKRLPFPKPRRERGRLRGEVLAVDRFGNLITNLDPAELRPRAPLRVGKAAVGPLRSHYAEVPPGRPVALVGSHGFVELALREGSLSARLGLGAGEAVYAG